ncbi:hypothetical protein [Porphyromonas gingivicanis]|uniref:hypothetical protein n=1 Tax=Porphyromonas gingivicanis TaxID=266762 RepID=UPI000AF17B49|nr:hypothetical protein [Porphyromonas gingivicanis]
MSRKPLVLALLWSLLFLGLNLSCGRNHFIKDKDIRERVTEDFRQRDSLLGGQLSQQFQFAEETPTQEELEALEFLYAYMPLSDIIDYSAYDHLYDVRASFQARKELPWGKLVPEREFLHFVLPQRVNNENLDGARPLFYKELKERVEGLSMREAALEVNHWCHEWVTYAPVMLAHALLWPRNVMP